MAKIALNSLLKMCFMFLFLMVVKAMEMKKTQLQFYMHDVVKARIATAVKVIPGSPAAFGMIYVIDDLLTEGPQQNSRALGRARGMYISDSLKEISLLLVFTVVFEEGEYKGSTLSFQGEDSILLQQREISVVGGTGHFRSVTGHAIMETHYTKGIGALLRYNVTVVH